MNALKAPCVRDSNICSECEQITDTMSPMGLVGSDRDRFLNEIFILRINFNLSFGSLMLSPSGYLGKLITKVWYWLRLNQLSLIETQNTLANP